MVVGRGCGTEYKSRCQQVQDDLESQVAELRNERVFEFKKKCNTFSMEKAWKSRSNYTQKQCVHLVLGLKIPFLLKKNHRCLEKWQTLDRRQWRYRWIWNTLCQKGRNHWNQTKLVETCQMSHGFNWKIFLLIKLTCQRSHRCNWKTFLLIKLKKNWVRK